MPNETPIPNAPLRYLVEGERFSAMDKAEAYYRGRQDDGKAYDWDGNLRGYGDEAALSPGWVVPHSQRRPSSRYDLGKLIVHRLTSMVFGQDHFPELRVEGDEDAEDYVRTLATEARLSTRMAEARNLGGATGTACLSFGFVNGCPRVQVHNPKHVLVVEWADEEEMRPRAVLKSYSYPRREYDSRAKKVITRTYWKVRWWDEAREVTWRDVPDEMAAAGTWQRWEKRTEIRHDYGFAPFYWIQNRPCSAEYDGEGDFAGQESTIDEVNRLMSATTKGTVANVDPTLVVHMDPTMNDGSLRKGSENAIFSPSGAEYLELKGTAVMAAERQIDRLSQSVLDVCGVILADPDKLSGAAQSARALEILYAPMLANCDILREQYGEHGIKPLLLDMLRVARRYAKAPAVQVQKGDATELRHMRVVLPPRMERSDDDEEEIAYEREPGTSEQIVLNWRPYFSPTWTDINSAVNAAKSANGGRPTISQRTSVQAVSVLFGVKDVDAEIEKIEREEEQAMKAAASAYGPPAPTSGPLLGVGVDDYEEDDDDDSEGVESVETSEGTPLAPAGADIQKTALNGAQVQALVAIVKDVVAGQLPVDAAVEIVAASFQMTSDEARRILGSAGRGFVPTTPSSGGAEK